MSTETNRLRRERNRDILRKLREENPCTDCGQFYPYYVMDFDHLDGADKTAKLSNMAMRAFSVEKIMEEVAKCEIVCANCHRIRTYKRAQ